MAPQAIEMAQNGLGNGEPAACRFWGRKSINECRMK
jgi:hypothetical protein